MCLSIPGKIVQIEKDIASVDYGGETRKAKIIDGDYKVGDFVIVSAKIVSEKVSDEQMKGWLELMQDAS